MLLRAGLPDRALKVLIDMDGQPRMRAVLSELLKAVKGGKSLSLALQPYDAIFGSFYLSMVRAGEASGQLSSVLSGWWSTLRCWTSIVSALIYPAILLVVAVLSVVVMLGFVVPQFETLFNDMGEGTAMTKAVIAAAEFIKAWGLLLGVLVAVLGLVIQRWAVSEQGKTVLDTCHVYCRQHCL